MAGPDPNLRDLFGEALQCPTPEEQSAYLAQACRGDAQLKARIEELLQAHREAGSFLREPSAPRAATIDQPARGETPGTVIGPYKLLEQIGEGGFGVVFLAEQTAPVRRKVALKVLKPGMDTAQVVARLEAERQALALMDHPNIAKVFDGGATPSGRPFFVMELVNGVPITDFCDRQRLAPRQRLELLISVCQAVQHAHQKGIIHRDLKPSNVLVTVHDATPVVKVIDFGVAKAVGQELTDKTLFTGFAQMVGTPLYMSPEQAGQNGLDVDTRSDIYSLGVLLYELLTGTTPFDKERFKKAAYDEIRRIIREEDPPRPSTRLAQSTETLPSISAQRQTEPARLTRLVRGELDWIVMKALEKDRNRRYETAAGFALDLQRYLADEPVLACPPSAGYRLRKFARRNKVRLGMAGLVLLFMMTLGGGVGWMARDRAARRAKAANDLGLALERAELYQGQGKRAEALAALERAELLTADAAPDPARDARLAVVRERLDAEARDLEFVARFEEIQLRVQSRVSVERSLFTPEAANPEIRAAFRQFGIDIGVTPPAQAAALIQPRPHPVRANLIAALDECLKWASRDDSQTRSWLTTTLEAVDHDDWRVQARKALLSGDRTALAQLAQEADERTQPANFLIILANRLPADRKSTRLELLRRVQRANPADLWANHFLAQELVDGGLTSEAIRYLSVAVALRPGSPGTYLNRGFALERLGEWDAAIWDARQCVALAPEYATAHSNLGMALYGKGLVDQAIAEYHEALRLQKDFAPARVNLGIALQSKGKLGEAIAEYGEVIQSKIVLPEVRSKAHYNLANALRQKGDVPSAIAEYRKAIALNSNYAEALCNLGLSLWRYGVSLREALETLRRGDEIGRKDPLWRYPSAQWVLECERERRAELEKQLPTFLEGKLTPASPGERAELAQLCCAKHLNRAAARFFAEAFAAQPDLAEVNPHRYNAACVAALAGCGVGEDAGKLDDQDRAGLRRQALDWLRADLQAWGRTLDMESDPAGSPVTLADRLKDWLADDDFAGVRGPEALARLPEAERQPWLQMWDDVAAVRARAQAKNPGKKSNTN